MRAYKGIVQEGSVQLPEGVRLPEGAVVTVTISEAEFVRATLRAALRPNPRHNVKTRVLRPTFTARRYQH